MALLQHIVFGLALTGYTASAVAALLYLRIGRPTLLTWAYGLGAAGAGALLATFGVRWALFGGVPASMPDCLNLFVLLTSLIALASARNAGSRSLMSFYAPALAIILLINVFSAGYDFLRVPPSTELNGAFLAVHVGLAFLAYALFFAASLTSAAYVFQAGRL